MCLDNLSNMPLSCVIIIIAGTENILMVAQYALINLPLLNSTQNNS